MAVYEIYSWNSSQFVTNNFWYVIVKIYHEPAVRPKVHNFPPMMVLMNIRKKHHSSCTRTYSKCSLSKLSVYPCCFIFQYPVRIDCRLSLSDKLTDRVFCRLFVVITCEVNPIIQTWNRNTISQICFLSLHHCWLKNGVENWKRDNQSRSTPYPPVSMSFLHHLLRLSTSSIIQVFVLPPLDTGSVWHWALQRNSFKW